MFDPPTPADILHTRFRKAAMSGNVQEVRQILVAHPEVANEANHMPTTVLQALCLEMFFFHHKPEHIDCMMAIVEAGGDMAMSYNYTEAPIAILLRRGMVPALRALQDKGLLGDAIHPENRKNPGLSRGVQGVQPLVFVCIAKQWRDLDLNYPIAEIVEVLLDAGALPHEPHHGEDKPPQGINSAAVKQLLWALEASDMRRPPQGCAKAFAMLMERDQQTIFDEELVVRAWRSKDTEIFALAAQRYFDQGGTQEKLQARAEKLSLKPELAAKLQSDTFSVMTGEATVTRKPGTRF